MDSLEKRLHTILPKQRVKARLIDRYAYASDASHFYLLPKAVVQPMSIEEVKKIFEFSHRENIPITFRAGGTSLSGQGVTDGILVDLSNYWRKVIPENDGATVRVEPAAIGANVNQALKHYGRKIGPDPASINAAMMGGILSNNSSGMCCGVIQNSYHTLKSMTFVLPNGMVFNSELPGDYVRFESDANDIAEELRALRNEILNNSSLVERIRKKYKQKNTVGYCMNAFIDYEHPLDILAHVIIGGEGTLAFIAEAVLNTVPDLPHKMTAMLYFKSPEMACNAIYDLKSTGAEALEFMDRASLRSVENMPGVPALLKELPSQASAILCEFQETTEERLLEKYKKAQPVFVELPLLIEPNFTLDTKEQAVMWKIRKGMYPSVAGMRARGTSALMEDFTFPVERLGEAVVDVQRLFEKYRYENGIIFGHAKDGNLHFVISQSFFSKEDVDHYEKFNDELFDLILNKYDGALKAEHSSGRAVSAYIEKEWGTDAWHIMKRLKKIIDPTNLLNPGIIITEDKFTHIHNLKVMPVVEEEVDKCIECGFCEQGCPSRDLTLTPRRRIGVRRAIKRLELAGDIATMKALLKDYNYDGIATCAVDGMCAANCPVDINTGDLIKRLRRENHSAVQKKLAIWVAKHFKFFEDTTRLVLRAGFLLNQVFGKNFMKKFTTATKRIVPGIPVWSNQLRKPGKKIISQKPTIENGQVVYFSSCVSRTMGGETSDVFLSVCKKANINVIIPEDIKGGCCGQIFSSKGYTEAYRFTANKTTEKLWKCSENGKIPVVVDVTSCTQTIRSCRAYLTNENKNRFDKMNILDVIDFAAEKLLPRLNITRSKDKIVFHPVCSVYKMGLLPNLQMIGKACAKQADIPTFARCCGMAGDKGFYYPQLTTSATRIESGEVKQTNYDGYYSSSVTCEMALSEAVGKNYESILKLLDEVAE
ncbi:FAD-binding and (Fe-S)-binding domain-containing protein [Terrimonas pollutisoli]|uniref:FAD-binding and (Fe-S)-binding domain-containing protein n=1 Tax=Terrimonas pollutisoli TaxID=3034147 RepID=UPI0023EC3363|nr:FAD-binding and (Fe-S)-binding domain-containing protein [Terrimonas sp. H1YJ31]